MLSAAGLRDKSRPHGRASAQCNSRPANWPRLIDVGSAALHNSVHSAGDPEERGAAPEPGEAAPTGLRMTGRVPQGARGPRSGPGYAPQPGQSWGLLAIKRWGGLPGLPGKGHAGCSPSSPDSPNPGWESGVAVSAPQHTHEPSSTHSQRQSTLCQLARLQAERTGHMMPTVRLSRVPGTWDITGRERWHMPYRGNHEVTELQAPAGGRARIHIQVGRFCSHVSTLSKTLNNHRCHKAEKTTCDTGIASSLLHGSANWGLEQSCHPG